MILANASPPAGHDVTFWTVVWAASIGTAIGLLGFKLVLGVLTWLVKVLK